MDEQNEAVVNIKNHLYNPPEINIKMGMSIEFVNNDTDEHTITSKDGLFDEELEPTQTKTIPFPEAGTFDYYCRYHPEMKGTVVVE